MRIIYRNNSQTLEKILTNVAHRFGTQLQSRFLMGQNNRFNFLNMFKAILNITCRTNNKLRAAYTF